MPPRLEYPKLAPEAVARMRDLGHAINTTSGLDLILLELVRLRASLMNGCHYCIHLHTAELRKLHEPDTRIDGLADWRSSRAYTHRERAALAWTEALTNIQDGHAPDEVYEELQAHFTPPEIANLTLAITTINAWNRIEIALGDFPGHAGAR
jgi:AhpD family alkylhydroperoxidase